MPLVRRLQEWHIFSTLVMAGLAIVVGVLYLPVTDAPFQGDDFRYVHYLFFNLDALLEGKKWDIWLSTFSGFGAWSYFRPMFQLSYLLDYLSWGLNPVGYHLTNLLLHTLTAFLVFILCWQLTRQRWAAVVAGLCFAIMPIHVEAVAWFGARADGLNALCYSLSVVSFVLFRQRGRLIFLALSIIAFGCALLAKEVAVSLPLVLLLYDWLYQRGRILAVQALCEHLLFWGVLAGYLGLRVALWGQTGISVGTRVAALEWDYLSQAFILALTDPFLSDMTNELRWLLLGLAGIGLLIYRFRRELWLGVGWIGATILPSLLSLDRSVFDRYVYLPSVGLALLLASVISRPGVFKARLSYAIGFVMFVTVVGTYAPALYARNEAWARAAQITQLVTQQVRLLHPTVLSDARLIFTNVPVLVGGRGMQAFGGKLHYAMQLSYKNSRLEVHNLSKFPVLTEGLERTYFFEYNRRRIIERVDLIRILEERNRCKDFLQPAVIWDFKDGIQGWEPWHDLTGFEIRDGVLITRSMGNDPYMASPETDIASERIGIVEVTMRVTANQPTTEGRIYWHASSSQDFEPELFRPFVVKADGEFHSYRVDIASGALYMGDRILRLRLDPTDSPAEVAIKEIRILVYCSTMPEGY